jgi:DNA-binding NarL/FixJ family response regulator
MRIAIAEDFVMLRDLLRTICTKEFGYEVVAEAGDGPQAVEEVQRTHPDLLLLDLHLPGFDGFTVIEKIREKTRTPRVLILSSYCDDYTVSRVEKAAVHGFIDKNASTMAGLREAMKTVADNGTYFSETFRRLATDRHADKNAFDARLSVRERAILVLIGRFLNDAEIARQVNISGATVEKHRFNIQRKLGLKSRTELMRYARDHGFITVPN